MEVAATILEWFRDGDNRGAVQALTGIAALLVAWGTGLLGMIARRLRRGEARPPAAPGRQHAESGGVNVGGDARDVTTRVGRSDDPA